MKSIRKALRPTGIFLAVIFLLAPPYYHCASAAMVGTKNLLMPDRHQDTRDYLHDLMSREEIQKELVARGIDPGEAKACIDSLSDDELELISEKIVDLPAGGDATGFVLIVGAAIIIVFVIVEYFSEVKMFPRLFSK